MSDQVIPIPEPHAVLRGQGSSLSRVPRVRDDQGVVCVVKPASADDFLNCRHADVVLPALRLNHRFLPATGDHKIGAVIASAGADDLGAEAEASKQDTELSLELRTAHAIDFVDAR